MRSPPSSRSRHVERTRKRACANIVAIGGQHITEPPPVTGIEVAERSAWRWWLALLADVTSDVVDRTRQPRLVEAHGAVLVPYCLVRQRCGLRKPQGRVLVFD